MSLWASCAASDSNGSGGGAVGGAGGLDGSGNTGNDGGPSGGSGGGIVVDSGSDVAIEAGPAADPKTCAEAQQSKTYIGCDFWPTVTLNSVWSIFDFAVVVANAQDVPADVTIEQGGAPVTSGQVPPNGLSKFYLPWHPQLKGPDSNTCGSSTKAITSSIRVLASAYHLTSSVPVTVYQFSALEYKGAGGPPGKDWSSCPGNQYCSTSFGPIGCFSFSNDASLLLPSTALTGNYRLTTMRGWDKIGTEPANVPAFFAVTGTADSTTVTVKVSNSGIISAGDGVDAATGGQVIQFPIDRGEVVEVVGTAGTDLAGTLIQATQPIQVISGMPCVNLPFDQSACDHIEESVFPAETLGKRYFVAPPTGPLGDVPGHIVRLVGNVDGTQLSYPGGQPPGAPTTLLAGQMVDLGVVKQAFEIVGDHEFAVVTFQLGASVVDPNTLAPDQKGDPAQSNATAVEQYRMKYVFLAPDDYDVSYVDIIMPDGANVVIDGNALWSTPQPLGSGYSIARTKIGGGTGAAGAHVLTSDKPVGIQVQGYGSYTSYQYPGGLNLTLIAPPPPRIK